MKTHDKAQFLRFLRSYVREHKPIASLTPNKQYAPLKIKPKPHVLNIPNPKMAKHKNNYSHPMKLHLRQ